MENRLARFVLAGSILVALPGCGSDPATIASGRPVSVYTVCGATGATNRDVDTGLRLFRAWQQDGVSASEAHATAFAQCQHDATAGQLDLRDCLDCVSAMIDAVY